MIHYFEIYTSCKESGYKIILGNVTQVLYTNEGVAIKLKVLTYEFEWMN